VALTCQRIHRILHFSSSRSCQGTASHADDLAYESSHWAGEELYEACHLIDRRDAIERRFRPGSSDRPRASWGFLHLIEAPGASV